MSSNPKVKPLPLCEWHSDLSHIIEDMNGRPINVHSLMAHNPDLLQAWWNFRNYSVKGGALGKRLGELVILRVSIHMKAWYEWGSHVERSLACGLTLEEIKRVKQGAQTEGWDENEVYLLKAVDTLIETHSIPEELLSKLKQYFDTSQIMDIIAIHGMYIILGCMINTWGLELDESVFKKLPECITQKDFEREFPR